MTTLIVSAWNNGKHHQSGVGYGFKVKTEDIREHFNRRWGYILLDFESGESSVKININKDSFWDSRCGELIKKEIGIWLRTIGENSWNRGFPPKFKMKQIERNRFKVFK